jgi:hypothetical protein
MQGDPSATITDVVAVEGITPGSNAVTRAPATSPAIANLRVPPFVAVIFEPIADVRSRYALLQGYALDQVGYLLLRTEI